VLASGIKKNGDICIFRKPLIDSTLKGKIIIYISLALLISRCDVVEVSVIPDYPITISPIGLLELDDLNTNYHQLNDNSLCSTLNEYGYTGFSRVLFPNDVNPCAAREPEVVELLDPEPHLLKAKEAVVFNQRFTNVSESEELVLVESLALNGCTICEGPETNSVPLEWKFTFAEQKFGGTPVDGSEITVFVDVNGVNRIWGNWFSEFYAPSLLEVGYLEAEASLVGLEIDLLEYAGVDSTLLLDTETIGRPTTFEIVPKKNESGELELRKSWIVPITFTYQDIHGLFANVDVVDASLIRITSNHE